jgi:hypothetical protein
MAVFTFTAGLLTAQLNVQSTRWAVPGKQIDFNNYPATASTLNSGPVLDGINSYTFKDGEMLFQIVDSEIKSVAGTSLASLGNSATWRGTEYATTEVKNDCNTFLTFYLERNYYSLFTNESLCFSKYSRDAATGAITMSVNGQVLRSENQDAFGGIALSKERADGSRFLYYASTYLGTRGYIRKYTISASGVVDNGVEIYTGLNNQPFRMTELELSHDGSRLAFSRAAIGPNINQNQDVVIFELNPSTGNLSNPNPVTINLRSNDAANNYPGIEFDANGQYLYVLAQGDLLYKINMSNYIASPVNGFNSQYCNSQLELGRDGWFYLAKSDGLYRMDASGNVSPFAAGTMASNDLLALRGCTVYVLPDQIDGQDYKTYEPSTDCCYEHNESPIRTAMFGVSHNSTTGDITITGSNVSWTQTSNPFTSGGQAVTDVYLKGSLEIEQGAKLVVYGLTLHFKEGESVDLDYSSVSGTRGPQLYLYSNSKLTVFDECDEDALWDGINLNGYWGYTQLDVGGVPTRQPKVYMSSGSTIEFAEKGIDVSGGGIVYGLSSNFKDNIIDVKFSSWNYDNISYFTLCDFYTTSELYSKGYNPNSHVHLWTAPGLSFSACDFRNDYASSVSISQRGVGILSSLSSITVKERCSVPQQLGYPCPNQYTTRGSFTDLYYGIKIDAGSFYNLSRIDFNNCVKAAWLISCDAITVTECDFDVSSETLSGSLLYDSFGLYIESSTGYHIEGNEFHDGVLGLVVYNSEEYDSNEIYRNDFYNLTGNGVATGAIGLGVNGRYLDTPNGLQFICNDFNQTDYAIAVTGGELQTQGGGQIDVIWSSISWVQGQNVITGNFESARNTFWLHGQTNENDFYIDYSKSYIHATGHNYRYNGSTDILLDRDANINSYNPSEVNRFYIGSFISREQACPQNIYSYGGIIIPLIETIGGFNEEEIELQNQIAELTSYNELELLIAAQTANVNNLSIVYNSLYSKSPHLTTEILLAYLNNVNISELSRTSLMLANSPLPKDVVEAVGNSDLSEMYKAYILKSQNGENEIEQKLNRISGLKSARQVNYDKLVRATFNADSTSDFSNSYDMILGFMETQTDLHAKEKLTDLYIHKGLYENALSILCDIENIAESIDDISLLNSVKIKEIKIDILRSHSFEEAQNVILNNAEFLTELAADYNTKEGGVARAILESAGLMENFPIVFLPDPASEIAPKSAIIHQPEDEQITNYQLKSLFKLYPNPANDYLSLEFINPNGNCTFNIYSIKGELLKTISTNQQLGFLSINISDLKPGNYIVNCVELQSNVNFVIAR